MLDLKQWCKKAINEVGEDKKEKVSFCSPYLDLKDEIQKSWSSIYPEVRELPLNWTNLNTKINLAGVFLKQSTNDSKLLEELKYLLEQSREDAKKLGDKRTEAIAIGYLGKLYQLQGDLAEAQNLTVKALNISNGSTDKDNGDIGYLLGSQLGSIYQKQDKTKENIEKAIKAYEAALQNLEQLRRIDLATNNTSVQFDFKDQIEPIYKNYIQLLLNKNSNEEKVENDKLKKARKAIESLQLAELEDYLQESCISYQKISDIDEFDKLIDKTKETKSTVSAVIHTVILDSDPNPEEEELSLEIILKLPKQTELIYKSISLPQNFDTTLNELFKRFYEEPKEIISKNKNSDLAEALKPNKQELLPLLQELYGFLIEPIKDNLKKANVDTLVFILDGRLQNIPLTTLHDGDNYLVENYSVALITGLELIDTKPLPRDDLNVLAGGMWLGVIDGNYPGLNKVKTELKNIKELIPNTKELPNQEFTEKNIKKELGDRKYDIIHFATHGEFSSNAEQTFIIAWDEKEIKTKDFSEFVDRISQTKKIGLLVLSACETAQGDRRAVLGLAGIAVKSGAASTIATLWNVEDESASILMSSFYKLINFSEKTEISESLALRLAQLDLDLSKKTKISKSLALRLAQLDLLDSSQWNHPFFWASYIVVGNWF